MENIKNLMTLEKDNENDNDNTLEDIKSILGTAAFSIKNLSNQMGIVTTAVADLQEGQSRLNQRMINLENNEEITTEQKTAIVTKIHERCYEILGDDPADHKKYFRRLCARLYSYLRKHAGLATRCEQTKKRDFDRVMSCIEAWRPEEGLAALKEYTDRYNMA